MKLTNVSFDAIDDIWAPLPPHAPATSIVEYPVLVTVIYVYAHLYEAPPWRSFDGVVVPFCGDDVFDRLLIGRRCRSRVPFGGSVFVYLQNGLSYSDANVPPLSLYDSDVCAHRYPLAPLSAAAYGVSLLS